MKSAANESQASEYLDSSELMADVSQLWDSEIIDQLCEYIRIPAKSPAFDRDWEKNGYLSTVLRNAMGWMERQGIRGIQMEMLQLSGRTPLLFFEIPASAAQTDGTVVLYGHLDKQPEMSGWRHDLGPWTPVLEEGRLYGRGSADDGYALYAAIAAVRGLQRQGACHPRIVGIFETCEESGSYDLLPYLDLLRQRLGDVRLAVCMDSSAGDYERLWLTTSLRGLVDGTLRVQVLTEGVHSGDASGIVPSSFRIMRQVLDRLEDSATGRLLPHSFHCEVPQDRLAQARVTAAILGDEVFRRFPWASHECAGVPRITLPTTSDPVQALLRRTWQPTLSVTGCEGLPALQDAGNVLRPQTAFKLSLRLPPLVDAQAVMDSLQVLLEDNAPFHARVSFEPGVAASGWNAPRSQPWFDQVLEAASRAHFGAGCGHLGHGGGIPVMTMLTDAFPSAQMLVCGVLGPKSNPHGPNEFLHIPYAKRLTAVVAEVICAFATGDEK